MFHPAGKQIAVIGMARSGLAAADVLARRGATVTLYDSGSADKLGDALAWAQEQGIAAHAATERVSDCDLAVTSPGVRANSPVLTDAVERGIPVWGEIEAAYQISRAPILAITGTNGKTTTAALLAEMFRAAKIQTYLGGNIAAGEIAMPLIRAADIAEPKSVIIAEISSFQLEWVTKFQPKVAAILNITTDHADRQTWDEYVAAKWNLFAQFDRGNTAVLRSDVPVPEGHGDALAKTGATVVYFDKLPRPDWVGEMVLPGEHNIENAIAAAAMAKAFGLPDRAIRQAATTFAGVVHRLEYVATINGVRYINNSMCTNNVAFARSLEAIAGPKIVLAGGVFKGGEMSELVDAATTDSVKHLVLYGRSGTDIENAVIERGFSRHNRVDTLADALNTAVSHATSGDTIILNPGCASFDQFKDFEDRGETFKRLVNNL